MLRRKTPGTPHWAIALIPFAVLVLALVFVVKVFNTAALDGGSQIALIISAAIAIGIGMIGYGIPWSSFEEALKSNMGSIAMSVFILLMIGAVAGTWMISGVVPTLIYYGLHIISPKVFLFACCFISALVSLISGSSWTTIATIGVALIGVGDVLGFSGGWTAGAIISGAYFGDKISPLSDTTVLASSSTGTELFTHIRYMLYTTVPSIVITLTVFLVVSILHNSTSSVDVNDFYNALEGSFNISGWLMLVPISTFAMILLRVPAVLTLLLSALFACIAAAIAQPDIVASIAGSDNIGIVSGIKGLMITCYGSTAIETGNAELNGLVATGGMAGMMSTIFLIISASIFGTALVGSGMIRSITEAMTRHVKGRTATVGATVMTGLFNNIATSDQYLSIILTASMYKDLYERNGLEGRLLSRTVEDSVTVTSVLVPWNTCGMTQATVLRVPTVEYLPYCLFNLISPLMSVLVAATGYKIFRKISPEVGKN